MTATKRCALCAHGELRPSWLGSISYRDRRFSYLECKRCGSSTCDPMPDDEMVAHMYARGYATSFECDPAIPDPKDPQRTLSWLRRLGGGTFMDYGCGQGALLVEAMKCNWRAIGVELHPEVARQVARSTGALVVSDPAELLGDGGPPADVIHLGDVIEHLTAVDEQLPRILRFLKPGGVLLAQGPLEAGPTLFTWALLVGRLVRRAPSVEMPPYHVLQATVRGQRALFQRLDLEELQYWVGETSWPAPAQLSLSHLKQPRSVALFCLRRLSQTTSSLYPGRFGNRYFYAGRWK